MKTESNSFQRLLPLFVLLLLLTATVVSAQPAPGTNNPLVTDPAAARAAAMQRMRDMRATNSSASAFPELPATPPKRVRPATKNSATNAVSPSTPVVPRSLQGLNNSPTPTVSPVPPPAAPAPAPEATTNQPAASVADFTAAAAASQAKTNAPETMFNAGEIDFPDIDLDQVLEVYAKLVNRTVLRAQLPQVKIKLRTQTALTTTEAIAALDSVMAMNGITTINVGEKFVKAVAVNLAGAQGTPFKTNMDGNLPETDQFVCQIVQLKNAKPSEIKQVLVQFAQIPNSVLDIDSSQMLVIRDYASNVKRMLEIIKQIDEVPTMDFDSEVIPIRYAKADEIASALSSIGAGAGSSIGHAGGSSGGTSQGGGLGGGSRLGGAGGAGGLGGGLNRGIGGGAAGGLGAAGGRTATFGDRLNNIIQKASGAGEFRLLGETKIIADNRTNSLLVFASKQDMAMIKKIIGELDTVLPQVLIEAIIMEVTLSDGRDVGVSLAQNQASTPGNYFSGIGAVNNGKFLNSGNFGGGAGTNLNGLPSAFSYWGNFGQDFQATLTASANDSRIHVLSRPRIQTSHGVTASLQVGQTVPEVSGTYFGGINGQASSQYQQQFVGIDLEVTPLINPDGLVVMEISQDVQQLGPNYKIDNNDVPSTTTRSARATVSVRDRDTIVLGGMISGDRKKSNSGVPFLKDIPGLGVLFRSSSQSSERVELIVLIHPTVLKTPEAASIEATRQKNHMPGIKAAEREDILEENAKQREANKIIIPKVED